PTNAGYVKVEEQIKNTTTKSEDTLQVLVSKQPIQRTLLGDEVCQNFAGQITVKNSESGVNYQLVNYNGGSYVGPYLSGNGGDLKLNTLPLQETGNFYVRAYNLGCELRMPADPGTVDVVVQKPDVQLAIDDTDHIICQGTSVNFTASDVATLADSFNFIVNESSVQSSASTSYTTTSLQHNDEIYVVGTTNKGCRDTSSVITVSVGKNIWSGATSNVWGNAGNWACTDLPSLTVNAFIPARATRMPIVGTHSSVKTIEVEAGASLTHSGGIFSIAGDIINRGTFSSSSTATIKLTGENKQKLIDNTGFNFGNLTVDKQGDSVILETKVDISGALTLTSGIVKTDDTNILTLENTASATPGNANSYVVGPMQKIGNTDFTFPIGAGDRRAMIGISDFVGAKSNTTMKAQYYDRKYSEPDNVDGTLHHVSEVEHWLLQNTTANGAKWNVTLYTDDVSLSNINTLYLTDLRVAYFDGVHWTDKGNGGTSFGANSGSIKSGDNFSPNGYFTFGSKNGDNPLPVELINFKAYLHNGQTLLTWLTTTEYNNSHFEVERSDNMIDFIKIGTVYSKAQNGSSTQAIDYAYTDDTPIAGTNYYRLKQVDFNGLYSYSKVVSVTSDRENGPLESIIVYPNPTTGLVNIIVPGGDENIHISLYNYNGALLLEYRHDPSNTIIDLSQYASGLYMLKISNGEKHIVQRVIKQ
ncbi:MAG TPA: T9SS type A sorting domain-containing protein, partial [Salinivirgaceae bacterium]|nr:T9SS type A sorting domain-containing protein [Salinivirgaceae bacterium]